MDFDSCGQLYEDFPSFMTPEYNIDELDEILRSTDANLSSGIGYCFPMQTESVLETYPSPPASSTSNCENMKNERDSPSDFNPDDFINFFSDEEGDGKSIKYENRTPSPTNSSSLTGSRESVVSMTVDTPPVSPPSGTDVYQLPPTFIPLNTSATPINLLQGTLIPVKTVPLTKVQVQNVRAPQKISPKPAQDTVNKPSKPKTIVLSSNDFKALMTKIQNGKANGTAMPKIVMKSATTTLPIQKKLSVPPKETPNNTSIHSEQAQNKQAALFRGIFDERHLKKQQRMIKNRQSASLSRKKKKDYVVSLETRINDLEKENTNLKGENTTLRSQLIAFAQTCQCSHLKISEFISNKFNNNVVGNNCHTNSSFKNRLFASNMKKNTAVLLAMVFMVSLNFGSFHTYFSQEDILHSPRVDFDVSFHTGRRGLLWVNDSGNWNITKPLDSINIPENETNFTENDDKCPVSINQTENLRLAGELRKWIVVNDYLNLSTVQEKPIKFKLTPEFLELRSMPQPLVKTVKPNPKRNRKNNFFNRQSLRNKKIQEHQKNSLKLFGPQIDNEYLRLFEEIKRRDDTFYVLSFNSDHILLPAAAYNKSTRPRMSVMLPAGDPSINGEITLMQIDCEVLNTTEVQLKPDMIPTNLRPKFNMNTPNSRDILNKTGGGPEKMAARNAVDRTNGSEAKPTAFYRPYFMAPHKHVNHVEKFVKNVDKQQTANVDSIGAIKAFQQDSENFLP